jgi:hypothetical protein
MLAGNYKVHYIHTKFRKHLSNCSKAEKGKGSRLYIAYEIHTVLLTVLSSHKQHAFTL